MPALRRGAPAALLLAAWVTDAAAESKALEGVWDTPLGKISIAEAGGAYAGIMASASKVCSFPKGAEVLRGALSDDGFTAEIRFCQAGGACKEKEAWALAVLLVGEGSGSMIGPVELGKEGCLSRALKGGVITLRRKGALPAADARAIAALREERPKGKELEKAREAKGREGGSQRASEPQAGGDKKSAVKKKGARR